MVQWRQTGVEEVTVSLEGIAAEGREAAGEVAGFRGRLSERSVTFVPQRPIVKAERALKLLLEPPGPLAVDAEVPEWLQPWAELRSNADSVSSRLRIAVRGGACTDTSVFDPTLTHRLLFVRRFHGYPERSINWLMANPIGGDTNDGRRPTLGKIRNLSFAWGYGTVVITNLFTARTVDFRALAQFGGNPNHPDADDVLVQAAQEAGATVLACGGASHDLTPGRYREVLQLLQDAGIPMYAVAREPGGEPLLTRDGRPLHPRTLPGPAHAAAVSFIDD